MSLLRTICLICFSLIISGCLVNNPEENPVATTPSSIRGEIIRIMESKTPQCIANNKIGYLGDRSSFITIEFGGIMQETMVVEFSTGEIHRIEYLRDTEMLALFSSASQKCKDDSIKKTENFLRENFK